MPVPLQVREVREAIYREARHAGPLTPRTTAEFGRLFHTAVASLFRQDSTNGILPMLEGSDQSPNAWAAVLRKAFYKDAVGPYLHANEAALQSNTADLLSFWEAVEQFCPWMAKILWKAVSEAGWTAVSEGMLTVEEPLSWELREPGWSDAVRLSGVADLVLRVPGNRTAWCVLEFKLGRTSPEADLAQACLYHDLLAASANSPGTRSGSLALVGFEPHLRERLFSTEALRPAQAKLKDLIGRLAGVSRNAGRPSQPAAQPVVISDAERKLEQILFKTFQEFNAPVERAADPVVGPAFIRFSVRPARGVKTKALSALSADLQVRMHLDHPPIIRTGPTITVDVQRPVRDVVRFDAIVGQLKERTRDAGSSQIPVGMALDNQLVTADLAESKHAHILVVGTTGSGKSEWLRTAIAGLILTNTPASVRFVLIDPKRLAFNDLTTSPYLFNGHVVYPGEHPILAVFDRLIDEMEDRYRLFQQERVDDLRALIKAGHSKPRIVCICDEYSDLLAGLARRERAELEKRFVRLGSKARACGIHLIIATQEGSRETVRGALDSNMPARVALRTAKAIESRLVLGENGAENLLGQGDLLFKDIGSPIRLQAPFLSKSEREIIFATR